MLKHKTGFLNQSFVSLSFNHRSRRYFGLALAGCLLLTCGGSENDSRRALGQDDLPPVESPAGGGAQSAAAEAQRDGIKATGIMTEYEYGEGINAAIGIPSGAKTYRTQNHERIGEAVLVASDATLVDEPVDTKETRVIRVNLSLHNVEGNEVAAMVAFFSPFADDAYVVKTVLRGRYESIYRWGDIPGHSLVEVTTTDLTTGKKVMETRDLEFIKDSNGLFRGIERQFSDGNTVFESRFVRDLGSGLLVEEQVDQGSLPRDYHAYEFVLTGWPSGSSPGFGGGLGF